ncbi:DUF429 domain-containing protein [Williamsia sp. CHRR-6]|uniref:DUF429 domain-containing protein n=1 Tax=Williamsia sp. CHRR-6 TaxID=2835871 RepID=UPI001BDB14AD|nr:DUF429 domain-containing protein [Williamsia sp. CHRR-6]MBT0565347.1 DUF429 domain-containing protein [Williamsia sp. CHRR-6]
MRTVGIDLAAEPAKTAVATIEWGDGGAEVVSITVGANDDDIVRIATDADRVGIDAPFGWPDAFVEFVSAHHRHGPPSCGPLNTRAARGPLVRRRTDDVVREQTGLIPLSVSADLIAHVALRCVGVVAALGVTDRVNGVAVEVYPAAGLASWGLRSRGYKGAANVAARAALIDEISSAAPSLRFGECMQQCRDSDDALDSVVAALIARAVAVGATRPPTELDTDAPSREGWIHLPTGTLADLI